MDSSLQNPYFTDDWGKATWPNGAEPVLQLSSLSITAPINVLPPAHFSLGENPVHNQEMNEMKESLWFHPRKGL